MVYFVKHVLLFRSLMSKFQKHLTRNATFVCLARHLVKVSFLIVSQHVVLAALPI